MRRAAVVFALIAACGGGEDSDPAVGPKPSPPAGDNDPAFAISGVRDWYLVGNDLTPGHDTVQLAVVPPADVGFVDVWLNDREGVRLVPSGGELRQILDVADLPPGEHELLLAADGADTAFARVTFYRSHPIYVVVSTDWDDADNRDANLERHTWLHENHGQLRLTHFVGPYTFTDTTVTPERVDVLVAWMKGMRDDWGDEIGLHIHPYCNFVESAGLACKTMPSTVYPAGDATGYTVQCGAYDEAEFTTLLEHADELFEARGLGKPTSFRAGGWTAELSTLRALANAGYVADTSANNWARMEEWDGSPPGATLYEWNMQQWSSIGDTSQPYYPSDDDIQVTGTPYIPVLEVPDNGILVDYVTAEEMIEIFDANFPGDPLMEPKAFSIGFHPPNFSEAYKTRIHDTLVHVDQHLAIDDNGPAVYATLSELVQVWKQPE